MHLDIKSRLKRGVAWNIIGSLFSQGALFLNNVLLANILGKTVFGEFGMIQSSILTISGVAQLAIGFTATKYVAEFRLTNKEKTGRILGVCVVVASVLGLLATLVTLAASPWLADVALKAPKLSTGLLIGTGSILFSVLTGFQIGALAGLERYGATARFGALHGIFQLAACSGAAWIWGINGAMTGFVLGACIRWVMFHKALVYECAEQGIKIGYQNLWNERDMITKFAFPAALSGFFSMPALWFVNAFLARLPDGYSQLGDYGAANSLKAMILLLPLLINNVGMSLMNSQKGLGNHRDFRELFWINLKVTAVITLAGFFFVALFGARVLQIFGNDFVDAETVLFVLALSAIPEALSLAASQVVQSSGKMWLSLITIALPRDSAYVIAAFYLIPHYGALGMASAYAISQIICLFFIAFVVRLIWLECNPYESKPGA